MSKKKTQEVKTGQPAQEPVEYTVKEQPQPFDFAALKEQAVAAYKVAGNRPDAVAVALEALNAVPVGFVFDLKPPNAYNDEQETVYAKFAPDCWTVHVKAKWQKCPDVDIIPTVTVAEAFVNNAIDTYWD